MRNLYLVPMGVFLVGCLEPLTAPELPTQPSTMFKVETIIDQLEKPWAVAELSGGDYVITEVGGAIKRVSGEERIDVTGLPTDIFVAGQGGLLDLVLAPDFEATGEIFISYAYGTQDANGTALMRATLGGDQLSNVIEVFRSDPPKSAASHFGGRIAFLPDETLVLTLGDGFAYREEAQKLNSHFGSLVRLNPDGSVPTDNPFVGQDDSKPEIYSYGHRNVQGLAYDAQTKTLWEHEHGPRGGDEINAIRPGENYGWPIATYGLDYQGAKISPFQSYEGMTEPTHVWTPSIAPSGLAIYRGNMFPEWNGHALVGGLASRDLRVVDLRQESGKSVQEVDLLSDLNARIRDVRVARDGAILVLTDDPENGQLLRITPQ